MVQNTFKTLLCLLLMCILMLVNYNLYYTQRRSDQQYVPVHWDISSVDHSPRSWLKNRTASPSKPMLNDTYASVKPQGDTVPLRTALQYPHSNAAQVPESNEQIMYGARGNSVATPSTQQFPAGQDSLSTTGQDKVLTKEQDTILTTGQDTILTTGQDTILTTGQDTILTTGQDTVLTTGQDTVLTTGKDRVLTTGQDRVLTTGQDTVLTTGQDTVVTTGQDTVLTKSHEEFATPATVTFPKIDPQRYGLTSKLNSNGVQVITLPKNRRVLHPPPFPNVDTNSENVYRREPPQVTVQYTTTLTTTVSPTTAETTPKPPPPVDMATHRGGYIMVVKFYEQQTMASGNLLELQCWARYLGLAVVKPFMYDSFMLTPLDSSTHSRLLKFEDIFDISHWKVHVQNEGYAPLADWSTFIAKAPRNVIYAQFKHPTSKTVRNLRAQGHQFPHPREGDQFQVGCKFNTVTEKKFASLKSAGFRIVKKVCFNFQLGDELTLHEFNQHLLGDYLPSQVTVLIDEWHGLGQSTRVLIKENICGEKIAFREEVRPSQRIVLDAERYAQKYLNRSNYLAVITRFEMTGLTRGGNQHVDKEDPYRIIPVCMKLTLSEWIKLKAKTGIQSTFLSIDIGRYGSSSFEKRSYYGHLRDMVEFVGEIYEGRLGVLEWERTFEDVSSTTDAGYVALLQQVLVTRAKCILFVGGGSFQRHALHLYQQLHPRTEDQCVVVVKPCTSAYRPVE